MASAKPTIRCMQRRLEALNDPEQAAFLQRFFKTGPGEYGEGDRFLGVRVPQVRDLVREFRSAATVDQALPLLDSPWHEVRLLGLLLMVERFRRGDGAERRAVYDGYLERIDRVNNWDLVDSSAPHIIGQYLLEVPNDSLLNRLIASPILWRRRIALLSTHAFIRIGRYRPTLRLVEQVMDDSEPLIHKAAGWMLREIGKRDPTLLRQFLNAHCRQMPRTMLRYAIERLTKRERSRYLAR